MAIDILSGIQSLYPEWKEPTAEEFGSFREQMRKYPGLAPTDYSKQIQESQDLGKLQLALSLMNRGFGGMGAQARPGEMAISTFGREVAAPIAADVAPIAQRLYDQRLQYKQAEKQDEANLTVATLGRMDAARKFDFQRGLAIADKVMDYQTALVKAGTLNLGDKVYVLMEDGKPVLRDPDDPSSLTQIRMDEKKGTIYDIHSQSSIDLQDGQSVMSLSDWLSSKNKGMGDPDFQDFYTSVLSGFPKIQRQIGKKDARGFVYDHIRARKGLFPFSPWDDSYLTDDQYKIAEKALMDLSFGIYKGTKPGAQVKAKKPLEISIAWHDTTLEDIFGENWRKPDGQTKVELPGTVPTTVEESYQKVTDQTSGLAPNESILEITQASDTPRTDPGWRTVGGRLVFSAEQKPGLYKPNLDFTSTRGHEAIQNRALEEAALVDPALNISVFEDTTPAARSAKITKVRDKLRKEQRKIYENPENKTFANDIRTQLRYLGALDKFVADMEKGLVAPVGGPFLSWTSQYLSFINDWFQGEEGTAAQQSLAVATKDMQALLARSLLADFEKGGRYSDYDLQGMQKIIPTTGKVKSFTMEEILNLRDILTSSIQHSLEVGTGTADIPDTTFRLAAGQGFDLGKIRPKNNFYSPYLPRPYPASGQMQPGYTPQDLVGIEDGYLLDQAFRLGKYEMPNFDNNGALVSYTKVGADYFINHPEQREILLQYMRKRRLDKGQRD